MTASSEPPKRPAFDPSRVRPDPEDAGLFASQRAAGTALITVSQLTRMIRGAITKELPGDIHVVGELSNVASPAGGHLYFTLKDDASEVRCVMWRSAAKDLRFELADGLEVIATGSVDVYEPRGQYQLYVRRMEPRGMGALELAFRQLKAKLEKEGLFDLRRKRPLPKFPRHIAIVTSLTGAAIRDILQTIERRFPCVQVCVYGVRVQGEGAKEEIADAVRRINRSAEALGGIDVMIVGRGGGSLEDLWAFNEEIVARAIQVSRIPVVSAVGHEVDFTIADFVADVRAATPTAAAELVVPVRDELLAEIDQRRNRLGMATGRLLDAAKARLAMAECCEWFRDPIACVRRRGQQVDEAVGRLKLAMSRTLTLRQTALHAREVRLLRVRPEALLARRRELLAKMEYRLLRAQAGRHLRAERRLREMTGALASASPQHLVERHAVLLNQLSGRLGRGTNRLLGDRRRAVESLEARLAASSHEQVLERGFTITRRAKDGRIVRRAGEVREGDRLRTQTSEGEIASRVIDDRQGELFW